MRFTLIRGTATVAAILCVVMLGYRLAVLVPMPDSDQYYHYAISRMTVEHGLLRQIPQVVGLGWDRAFPEKEFLYHVLSAVAYWLCGETGVRALATVFLALTVLALALFAQGAIAGEMLLLGVGWAVLLTDRRFVGRMLLVRPHTLAALLLVVLLLAILRRRRMLGFVMGALFSLAYHAIYLPLALVVCCVAVVAVRKHLPGSEGLSRVSVFVALGVLAGALGNPYFPASMEMGAVILAFSGGTGAEFGAALEFERLPLVTQLTRSPAPFAAFAVALVLALGHRRLLRDGRLQANQVIALTISGVFCALAVISPRGFEYFPQLATVAFMVAAGEARQQVKRWILSFIAVLCLVQAYGSMMRFGINQRPMLSPGRQSAYDAALALPKTAAMVFNCSYSIGPYLLYLRPNVQFVDILDPRLLLWHSLDTFKVRRNLVDGQIADPYAALREVFKADYVVCYDPRLIAQMEHDPRFERIYPTTPPTVREERLRLVRLYRLSHS